MENIDVIERKEKSVMNVNKINHLGIPEIKKGEIILKKNHIILIF